MVIREAAEWLQSNGQKKAVELMNILKTVEQISRISGIGENKLRDLMDKGEIEYLQTV